ARQVDRHFFAAAPALIAVHSQNRPFTRHRLRDWKSKPFAFHNRRNVSVGMARVPIDKILAALCLGAFAPDRACDGIFQAAAAGAVVTHAALSSRYLRYGVRFVFGSRYGLGGPCVTFVFGPLRGPNRNVTADTAQPAPNRASV